MLVLRQEIFQIALEAGEVVGLGAGDGAGGHGAVAVQVDEPHALGMPGLGERVGQRRSAVADAVADLLAAVQVAEGHVVHSVEQGCGDVRDAADGDVALAGAGLRAGDEGMGQDDRAGTRPGGEVFSDPVHRCAQDCLVAGGGGVEALSYQGGLEVGQTVEGDVAVLVLEQYGAGHVVGVGAQVDAGVFDQSGVHAESAGRVVVPADHDEGDLQLGKLREDPLEQVDGLQWRDRPVVDVACYGYDVHMFVSYHVDQVLDEEALGGEEGFAVEGAAQVPVRGVQDPHGLRP